MARRRTGDETTERAAEPSAEQQFLRLMSHEMRTPLNGVIGMLGLLQRTRLDGAQRAYLDSARSSATPRTSVSRSTGAESNSSRSASSRA